MARIDEFDGNEYVNYAIDENEISLEEMERMVNFFDSHKNIFLYGHGMCGTGFMKYAEESGFDNVRGYVTSDTITKFVEKYKQNEDGIILTLKSDYYHEIMPFIFNKINVNDVFFMSEKAKNKFILPFSDSYIKNNFWLTLVVTKHCNINCASCSMFAPLCKPEFYSLLEVKRDMEQIERLELPLKKINITGGEPFLNNEIIDILLYVRDKYPTTKIEVYTNLIMARQCSDEQFRKLKRADVEFHVTEYGLYEDDLNLVYEKFDEYDINYVVNKFDKSKLFFKKRIDFAQRVKPYEYINCQFYSFCYDLYLFNGKLYKCPLGLNAERINSMSEKKIEITDKDYLILQDVSTYKEIHNYWKSKLPLCRYCPSVTHDDVIEWKRSERRIEEWM